MFTNRRHSLANGLRIVHSQDTSTAMVAVNILYNVGSRDENRELTGIAHLFEHLMFGGSGYISDFDAELELAGGKSNAWTSCDFTNFYQSIPSQNVETAFHLESDRMLALAFTDSSLDIQKGVVIEEFKQQCLDRPYGKMMHSLRKAMYSTRHPYSWPTIGLTPEHIGNVTMDNVKSWFYSHYAPNNAILSVTGNISFERTIELAEKWFGDIPYRDIICRSLPDPGFPKEDIYTEVFDSVPATMLVLATPMDPYGTQGYFAADAITDLLSAGRASRMTSRVIYGKGRGLIMAADASIIGSEHEGMLIVVARLARNGDEDIAEAREIIMDECRRLSLQGEITPEEWQRSLNNFEATFRFGNLGYVSRASNLAMAEYHDEDLNRVVADRRSLDPSLIARFSDKLFNSAPVVTLAYRPNIKLYSL